MKQQKYDPEKVKQIVMAISHMKRARDLLREARAAQAADYAARALKSADGARRHAHLRQFANERLRLTAEAKAYLGETA